MCVCACEIALRADQLPMSKHYDCGDLLKIARLTVNCECEFLVYRAEATDYKYSTTDYFTARYTPTSALCR